MKTNYQTQGMKLIFLLTLFVMLLQNCTKDAETRNDGKGATTYYYLTAVALNQTPYFTNSGFDTISFASNKGDTLTFVKTKTDTTWYSEYASNNPDNNSKNLYQTIHNTYTTIKGSGSFDVKHSKKIHFKVLTDVLEIKFNNILLLVGDYRIGSMNGTFFYQSLIKNNVTYYNAIKIYHNLNDSSVGEGFINKDFGFFSTKDNQTNLEYNLLK